MTMKLLVVSLFIALANASFDSTKFTQKQANYLVESLKDNRLQGGENAGDLMYPYAAELNVRWIDGRLDTCTGALLSTTYVITARKCLLYVNLLNELKCRGWHTCRIYTSSVSPFVKM